MAKIGSGNGVERDKLDTLSSSERKKRKQIFHGKVEFNSGAENEGRVEAAKEPLLQEPRHFWGAPNVSQLPN